MARRFSCVRRYQLLALLTLLLITCYYLIHQRRDELDLTNRAAIIQYLDDYLQDALQRDKGTGCQIPLLDPFDKEAVEFDGSIRYVECSHLMDWVSCHISSCRVQDKVLQYMTNVTCDYRYILYYDDFNYTLQEEPTTVLGGDVFTLTDSDFAEVSCRGSFVDKFLAKLAPQTWTGYVAGLRETVDVLPPPLGRENTLNVLMLGFDSTPKSGFIRRMPKSYQALLNLSAVILNGYNTVGDCTVSALFPILTGHNELELPDMRRDFTTDTVDSLPFIFYKLRDDGYRTAYYEDSPATGTFQYRFNGFSKQPTDHYLRAFEKTIENQDRVKNKEYCVGSTPHYGFMMNLTKMFFEGNGKKYCFTFIADISHDDLGKISTADEDLEQFLREFRAGPRMEDTLLMVFSDHGPRFGDLRNSYVAKLEERLPLMAILLPEQLLREQPEWGTALRANVDVLTTPHDVYATVMHALDWKQHWNEYKVPGADLKRGLTLFEPDVKSNITWVEPRVLLIRFTTHVLHDLLSGTIPYTRCVEVTIRKSALAPQVLNLPFLWARLIPSSRSCSEAGIHPHWCTCVKWSNVSSSHAYYQAAAKALVDYINKLTELQRDRCAVRTLTTIHWVMRREANPRLLQFGDPTNDDRYVGEFDANTQLLREDLSVKITVGPGEGIYEAGMVYSKEEGKFEMTSTAISRTNAYHNEPSCISAQHPHLNPYCYCVTG